MQTNVAEGSMGVGGSGRGSECDLKQIVHPLAIVVGIADEPLADRIDEPIEGLQRNLADQHGATGGQIANLDDTVRRDCIVSRTAS